MPTAHNLSKEKISEIVSMYESGVSLRKMVKETGFSRGYLSKLIKSQGTIIRDNSINSRKYTHNYDFFESIDSEEKAYWLGFIASDGFIESKRSNGNQKVGITIAAVDDNHLYKFKEAISATNPVAQYKGTGYVPGTLFSKILLTSQKTVDDLKDKGVIEHKSKTLKFPTKYQVPRHLIHHYMRGYFDGDGSISYHYQRQTYKAYEINVVGTKDFLEDFSSVFGGSWKLYTKDGEMFQLSIGGNKQLRKIYDFLYNDATIFLDRKYEKFQGLLKYTEK